MAKPITKEGYDNVKVKIFELKTEFESLPEIIAEARKRRLKRKRGISCGERETGITSSSNIKIGKRFSKL